MDVESRIELYQNLYTQEVERRDRIHARVNFPFASLLALSGLVAYIVQNIPVFSGGLAVVFWGLFAIAMLAIVISFVFLCFYLFKYSDCLVASPEEMDGYYVELEKHHGESKEQVDKAFAQYRLDTFKEAGTNTGKSNDQRSENIYNANRAIVAAIVAVLLSLIPFYIADNKKPIIEERSLKCQSRSHHLHHLEPAMSKVTCLHLDHQMYQGHLLQGHHHHHKKNELN